MDFDTKVNILKQITYNNGCKSVKILKEKQYNNIFIKSVRKKNANRNLSPLDRTTNIFHAHIVVSE